MIRELFCEVWRTDTSQAARMAKIEARAAKLYPHNITKRRRYVAMQVALSEGMNK